MRLRTLLVLSLGPLAISACALVLGLDDHEAFPDPGADGGGGDAADSAPALDGSGCGDTRSDPNNCGACGNACVAGYACSAGVCGNKVAQVAAGGGFGCVLLHGGEVWCWGSNIYGQLGNGVFGGPDCGGTCRPAPGKVKDVTDAVQISAGLDHACVRKQNGTVMCWGRNNVGQLGFAGGDSCTNGVVCSSTPKPVGKSLPPAVDVAAGEPFACAVAADGTVRCWGDNTQGELGIGSVDTMAHPDPIEVAITGVDTIATGRARPNACAVKKDGSMWCWGQNLRGVLGHVGTTDIVCNYGAAKVACNGTPAPVGGFVGFNTPALSLVACAKKDGFYCWGFNGYGQIGIGLEDTGDHPTPAPVTVIAAEQLAAGSSHSCAIDATGAAWCWGLNFWGELGDGTVGGGACEGGQKYCVVKATKVRGLSNVVAISAGSELTLALTGDGAVWSWGANIDARLGHVPGISRDGGASGDAWDGAAADMRCFPDAGGGPCDPSPSRVLGLP